MTRKEALQELLVKVKAGDDAPFHGFADIDLDVFTQGFIDDVQRAFHGSMDAALSLLEAVLPGWIWGRDEWGLMYVGGSGDGVDSAGNPARALLIAILEALVGMEE